MPIMPSRLAPSRRAETPRSPPPSPLPLSLVPVRQPPGRLGDAVCELKRLINIWNKGGRFRGRTPERYTAGYDGRYWVVKGREGRGRGRGWTATWDTILGFGTLRKNPSSRVALHTSRRITRASRRLGNSPWKSVDFLRSYQRLPGDISLIQYQLS